MVIFNVLKELFNIWEAILSLTEENEAYVPWISLTVWSAAQSTIFEMQPIPLKASPLPI